MGVRNDNSTEYVHPDEPNLLNLHKAMQYNANGEPEIRTATAIEGNIIIEGDVNIPGNIAVFSTPELPVHTHITEVGTSGILDVPFLPISGNVIVSSGNIRISGGNVNANVSGSVIVSSGNVNASVSGSVSVSSGNITVDGNVGIIGNVTVLQGTIPWSVFGNVEANITGGNLRANVSGSNVNITTMPAITGNVEANITGGNIIVSGNVDIDSMPAITGNVEANITGGNIFANVTQGTSPWVTTATITSGNVTVSQADIAVTAFDEPIAIPITPVIQADAMYGLDPDFWVTTKLNGGNIVVTSNTTWQVSSGTSPGGYARLATSKYMSYQDGQGSLYRWTAAFTATGTTKDALGVDNIVQNTGPIDREDGYSFGYSGSSANDASRKIGILHRRAGKTEIRKLVITTGPGGNQNAVITLNGIPYTVAITAGDIYHAANEIATKLKAIDEAHNLWDIEGCNGEVTFSYYSPGAKSGTYSFSSTGTGTIAVASFSQVAAGVTPNDTWTYVDQWDNQDIQFDPTKLNVYAMDMRWLGAGRVRFFMEDPVTAKMTLVHTQRWAGTQVYPHINKPSLRVAYRSGTTNPAITPSQNVIVTGASVFSGVQGIRTQTGSSQGRYNIDGTTRAKDSVWHLMSLQNPFVRNNGVNKASLMIQTLTVAAQGNDPSVIYIVKDAFGLSDVLAYIAIPNTTPAMFAQYSISAVTVDLATQRICNVQTLGINGNATFDLAAYNLTLAPGETISVFISSSNSLTRTAIGLTWLVD